MRQLFPAKCACVRAVLFRFSSVGKVVGAPGCSCSFAFGQARGVLYVSVKQGQGEQFDADERYGGIRKFYAFYGKEELLEYFAKAGFDIVESGVADHREKDSYTTHPFIHVFAIKPKK